MWKTARRCLGPAALAALFMAQAAAQAADPTITLTVAPWGGMGETTLQKNTILAEYQKLHPNIKFNVISLPMNSAPGLLQMLLLPQMPDVVETHLTLFADVMRGGLAQPVPKAIAHQAESFFFAPVLEPITYSGQLYALPTEVELYGLAYNQRLFAEDGLGNPPQTWAELQALAKKGTHVDATGKVTRYGLSFPGNGWSGQGESNTHTFLNLLWSNNGVYIDGDGHSHLTDPAAIETVQFLADMARANVMSLGGWGGLGNQSVLMGFLPSWTKQGFQDSMKDDFANLATTLTPHGADPALSTEYGWGFFVPKKSAHPKEAWEFLQWLTLKAGEATGGYTPAGWAMASLGSFPSNPTDYQRNPELAAAGPWWSGFIQGLQVARAEPNFPRAMDRWRALGTYILPALQGKVTPQAGLENAQMKVLEILTHPEAIGKND